MKVIFLDIDGVLNTYDSKERAFGYIFVEDRKVALLQQLVERSGAKIVLSSTWREGWDMQLHPEDYGKIDTSSIKLFEALKQKLLEYDMELLDHTPVCGKRGKEIDAWLHMWQGEPIESFVILDDMSGVELRPHSRWHIQTGITVGLQQKHIEKALKMLERSDNK